MAIHAIHQTTRLNNDSIRKDSTYVLPKSQSYLLEKQLHADDREHWNKLESAWLEGIWLGRDSKTDEHLIGTPNGMVRCRALKSRVERRRWDIDLLNAMIWHP